MLTLVNERKAKIRGVSVRWVSVVLEGHTIEQILIYDVSEAETVYGRPFDDEMDRFIQMGLFATDRIATDGTMWNVASSTSYLLDGKCIRTAKVEHCKDIEPMSAGWTITRSDGTRVETPPWSCVQGTPPISHERLLRYAYKD